MPTYKDISPYIQADRNIFTRIAGYIGLTLGVLLLLCAVQLYFNIDNFLGEKTVKDAGYSYISVTKKITDQNMGKVNHFSMEEVETLREQSFVNAAAPLVTNRFSATIEGGTMLPFSTDLFLEAIDNEFIDEVPEQFTWQPGQAFVPIILAADYLELYNIFAPGNNLPQISENSLSNIQFRLICSGVNGHAMFSGRVVGLSHRINSVLAPKSFLLWANNNIAGQPDIQPTRVYIKTTDITNPALLEYFEKSGYHFNKERSNTARIKSMLNIFVTSLGLFAILVILLSVLLFQYYLQLMISRSKQQLYLLKTLGYSPVWLSKVMNRRWVPIYCSIILIAIVLASIFQWLFRQAFAYKEQLSPYLNWQTMLIAIIMLLIFIFSNRYVVRKELAKI